MHTSPSSDTSTRDSISCTFTVVAAAQPSCVFQAFHFKHNFQQNVEKLVKTVFTAAEFVQLAPPSLHNINVRVVESHFPGTAILCTVLQMLKTSPSPFATFMGFAAIHFDGASLLPLPFHPIEEDKVRKDAVFFVDMSLNYNKRFGITRVLNRQDRDAPADPLTTSGDEADEPLAGENELQQSLSDDDGANEPSATENELQQSLSDDDEAYSTDEISSSASEADYLLRSGLAADLESKNFNLADSIDRAIGDKTIQALPYGPQRFLDANISMVDNLGVGEDLPYITCDMSSTQEVEYMIKQRITDEQRSIFQLCPERYNRIDRQLSLQGLPARHTAVREELENLPGVIAFRRRRAFATQQHAAQILSIKDDQVGSCRINKSLYLFSVANGDEKSRAILLQLYTDPRLMPYAIQLSFGQRSIPPEMADSPEYLGVYFIVVILNFFNAATTTERTDQNLLQNAIYTGSAIFDEDFACRIPQHEASVQFERSELVRLAFTRNAHILRVHLAMAKPGSKHSYKRAYQIPPIDDPELRPLARMSVALLESFFIGEGTLSETISRRHPWYQRQSLVISKRIRRDDVPLFDGWTGLNFVSPTLQETNLGVRSPLNIRTSSPIWQYLAKHYEEKHELYLTRYVAEQTHA